MGYRTILPLEQGLVDFLVRKAGLSIDFHLSALLVEEMQDSGMGSLRLLPPDVLASGRKFGRQAGDFQFQDVDGVDVIVTLNLDSEDRLYELDIWKMDYTKLLMIPDQFPVL